MVGGKRGFKFTTDELESLAESVKEFVPISGTEWEQVWNGHISIFPNRNWTAESLKCKFQEIARAKIPTGDPECPRHIRMAKQAYRQRMAQQVRGLMIGKEEDLGRKMRKRRERITMTK